MQQVTGTCLQFLLLATLSAGAGLGPVGWIAGAAYAVGLWMLLVVAVRQAKIDALGPADLVTLVRAVLGGGVTALVADGIATGGTSVVPLVVIATAALLLDALDGHVARRTGTESAFGARFDMEVDAFLLLVLSIQVAGVVGPWALAIGGMRYAFVAAGRVAPWLRSALPPRYSAKVVAALQGVVLVVVAGEILPHPLAVAAVAAALALLSWSFGRDVRWLWVNGRRPGAARTAGQRR